MKQKHTVCRLVTLLALGICDAIESGHISIYDAERMLFAPRFMNLFEGPIRELIHMGTELEDLKKLLPQEVAPAIEEIRRLSYSVLDELEPSSGEDEFWIDQIVDG